MGQIGRAVVPTVTHVPFLKLVDGAKSPCRGAWIGGDARSRLDPSGRPPLARDGAGVILDSLAESVSGSKPPSYEDHSQYARVRMAFRVA